LGGLTLISFMLQALTGILLVFYYDPSVEGAYNSVDYITYLLPLGWLVRGVHHYGSSAMVILVSLHMLRTYFFSAYKRPREINWLTGVLLLFLVLAFGFTGYLLPWDQKGYWATKVGTEIAGSVPFFGPQIRALMRGGESLGQVTLTRFYATHIMLLPATVGLLIVAHIFQLRFHGMAPPITEGAKKDAKKFVPFFPHWVITDVVAGLGMLALLVYMSWANRAPLEFPADPTSSSYIPRPEWYFLFYFQLLKYFPGALEPVVTVAIPLFIFGSMVLLPFIDTSTERRPWRKPVTTLAALFYIVVIVLFTILGMAGPA
jgi:ubiquinol-cytochrome c reductase cytochrome b subunit